MATQEVKELTSLTKNSPELQSGRFVLQVGPEILLLATHPHLAYEHKKGSSAFLRHLSGTRVSRVYLLKLLIAATIMAVPVLTKAQTSFGGVAFPEGISSFADRVVSSEKGAEVLSRYHIAEQALGPPDVGQGDQGLERALSLGEGGSVILEFTDNALTTSGDRKADLHVFEVGTRVEVMQIEISKDGQSWISLGQLRGQPTSIDIDSFAGVESGERYSFVRIQDVRSDRSGGNHAGADIDAVGAITSAPPVPPLPPVAPGPPMPTRVHGSS
ncbi:MAG: hypothetical protein AAGG56_06815 [Pseudomonadota bacterium]